jgi:hypothetical protein
LIDAYDAESIHSTSYFNGEVTWSSESERWARHGKVDPLPGEDGVFAATLTVSRETVQRKESTHFRFMQRAFRSEQLFELLHKQGLRLLASESDPPRGRLYQMYSPG